MKSLPSKQALWRIGLLQLSLLIALTSLVQSQSANAQLRRNRGNSRQNTEQSKPQEKAESGESKSVESESKPEEETEEKAKPKKVKIGGIEWYVDYDAALKIAQEEKKPMWLHFGENPG